jgi:WD repeat-containing protein 76
MNSIAQFSGSRRSGNPEAFVSDDDREHQSALKNLREQVQGLKVISRAKVTMHRIYSVAYHPEVSKDLIFFGGSVSFTTVYCWLAYLFL